MDLAIYTKGKIKTEKGMDQQIKPLPPGIKVQKRCIGGMSCQPS